MYPNPFGRPICPPMVLSENWIEMFLAYFWQNILSFFFAQLLIVVPYKSWQESLSFFPDLPLVLIFRRPFFKTGKEKIQGLLFFPSRLLFFPYLKKGLQQPSLLAEQVWWEEHVFVTTRWRDNVDDAILQHTLKCH